MQQNRRRFLAKSVATGLTVAASARLSAATFERDDDPQWFTLRTMRDRIARGDSTSLEATKHMLDRIEKLDPRLHSFITVTRDEALSSAELADSAIRERRPLGALHGVPIAVKDLCCTKGIPTTAGTKVFQNYVPEYDATVVSKLRQAGAVLLGKLNLGEGAMIAYNPAFEVPVNPWDDGAWPGASSSGSGVATAAGMAYGTIGTDTGGSIRYPAAYCGVVGLKPSWGRVSRYGVLPLALSLDHVGPLARSTADCALMLDVISGHDLKDPTSSLGKSMILPGIENEIAGLKLGWDEDFATTGVDQKLAEQLISAKEAFNKLGVQIVDVEMPDLRAYGKDWVTICSTEAYHAHSKYYPDRASEYGPGFRGWLERGRQVSGSQYVESIHRKQECVGRIAKALRSVDAFICPVDEGQVVKVTPAEQYDEYSKPAIDAEWARFTAVFNFNGAPSLTLPCGLNNDGLPLAFQLIGHVGREDVICRLGHAYEKVTSHHELHPELRV